MIWKLKATPHGHLMFQLSVSMPTTKEKGFGLWRTPETSAGGTVSQEVLEKMAQGDWIRDSGQQRQLRLQDQVRHPGLWPTPRAQEPGRTTKGYGRGLAELVEGKKQLEPKRVWPTPTTQEIEHPNMNLSSTGRRLTKDGTDSHSIGLADSVKMDGGSGSLNPAWVEWLMGYPEGWTELED
jgi:hypothetical protein